MNNWLVEALVIAVRDLLGLVLRLVGAVVGLASGLFTALWVMSLFCAGAALVLGGITWLLDPHAHVGRVMHLAGVLALGGLAVYLVQHFALALAGRAVRSAGRSDGRLSPPSQPKA